MGKKNKPKAQIKQNMCKGDGKSLFCSCGAVSVVKLFQ